MLIAAGFQSDNQTVAGVWLKESLRGKWMPILDAKGKTLQQEIASGRIGRHCPEMFIDRRHCF
jgi:hypothetical protein